MKNELILAKFTGQKKRASGERLQALLKEFGVEDLMGERYPLAGLTAPQSSRLE
jgi:hypothetical protein